MLDELRELANRVPFDERGNLDIKLEDISTLLLREYLPKGKMKNPHNFTEKIFKGSVPQLIKQTMEYLRTSVLYETVQKVPDRTICYRARLFQTSLRRWDITSKPFQFFPILQTLERMPCYIKLKI